MLGERLRPCRLGAKGEDHVKVFPVHSKLVRELFKLVRLSRLQVLPVLPSTHGALAYIGGGAVDTSTRDVHIYADPKLTLDGGNRLG